MTQEAYEKAVSLIDAANREDPNIETVDGRQWPKELLYSYRMSDMLERYKPTADEIIKLAIRGQHIQRWKSPRNAYPMDRKGYHQWRTDLYFFPSKFVEGRYRIDHMFKNKTDEDMVEGTVAIGKVVNVLEFKRNVVDPGRFTLPFRLIEGLFGDVDSSDHSSGTVFRKRQGLGSDTATRLEDRLPGWIGGVAVEHVHKRRCLVAKPFVFQR